MLQVATALNLAGLLSEQPEPNHERIGRFFFATDTGAFFRDNGTTWEEISHRYMPQLFPDRPQIAYRNEVVQANDETIDLSAYQFTTPALALLQVNITGQFESWVSLGNYVRLDIESETVTDVCRQAVVPIPGAKVLTFSYQFYQTFGGIDIRLLAIL